MASFWSGPIYRSRKHEACHLIVTWIQEAWAQLDKELVFRLFKPCALILKYDGSKDKIIPHFKSGSVSIFRRCISLNPALAQQFDVY